MSTYNVKMEGSEQERQLLEILRDHGVDVASDFRLLVQKQDGAWDVTLSFAPTTSSTRRAGLDPRSRRLGQHGATVDPSTTKRTAKAALHLQVVQCPSTVGSGRVAQMYSDWFYSFIIGLVGAILFLLVDKYEPEASMARLLKFLILFVAGVAILHKLQPYGLALF